MQVFKLCLKIIKKNIPVLLIYIIVFLTVSITMTLSGQSQEKKMDIFSVSKTNIAFFSKENTPFVNGLKEELSKIANFIDLPDETKELQDALYFREVTYIIRVPEGFTEKFLKGDNIQLEKMAVPNSISNTYIDLSINKYLNTARLYTRLLDNINEEKLVEYLRSDLTNTSLVSLKTAASGKRIAGINYYFNYLAYTLLAILLLGMSSIMLSFNQRELRMRNTCSPVSPLKMKLQLISANLLFAIIAWAISVILCSIVNFKDIFNLNTAYLILNSFVFTICGIGISFLVGNLVNNRDVLPSVSNVVTLGLSFISGVFVPQELLGEGVLKTASFMPTYWYVKANNMIAELERFSFEQLKPILSMMLIQLAFALAFFAVALVVRKQKKFE
ncbi:MAG: ABC transporter permease [Clostridiaceae bacterium]|nr:ABC transporter permease [Clostridiaceae bacterium]